MLKDQMLRDCLENFHVLLIILRVYENNQNVSQVNGLEQFEVNGKF